MKELSIEEKAKAYDEALKVLHKYDGANIMFSQSLKEEMFPELAEAKEAMYDKPAPVMTGPIGFDEKPMESKTYEQKPAEWDDEDEDKMQIIINIIKDSDPDWEELINWLKSLKDKVQPSHIGNRVMSSWKS